MKANEVLRHFHQVGHWAEWGGTRFLHGDPHVEVKGIATAWCAATKCIQEAADKNLNLLITHEHGPVWYRAFSGAPSCEQLVLKKKKLLNELGVTLLSIHDTWERMPEVGTVDAWADFLGFETEARPVESFYKICLLGKMTVDQIAGRVMEKVRPLGQDTVLILGDGQKQVSRMAIAPGSIKHFAKMMSELKPPPDIILATDGLDFWANATWANDLDLPVLIVNHCLAAEKPGVQAMAPYLREKFPGLPVQYLDVAFAYRSIR